MMHPVFACLVRVVCFQPKGKLLASSAKDGAILVWDGSGKKVSELKGHTSLVRAMAFHPQGKMLPPAAASGRCFSGTWRRSRSERP